MGLRCRQRESFCPYLPCLYFLLFVGNMADGGWNGSVRDRMEGMARGALRGTVLLGVL